jgi:hypothetical protein
MVVVVFVAPNWLFAEGENGPENGEEKYFLLF